MAQGQTTGTIPQALGAYYDKKFIEWEKELLRMKQFAQTRPLPRNIGTQAFFTGYRPLPLITTALTEGSAPTAGSFEARQISATVQEWGATAQMSELLEMTKLDPALVEQIQLTADQAARTLEYNLVSEVAQNGIWGITAAHRDSNQVTIEVSNDTTSNSTSSFRTTVAQKLDATTATWTGAIVTVISDSTNTTAANPTTKYGYAGRISAVTSSDSVGDFVILRTAAPYAAAPEAFQSGDLVRVVALSNIGSDDTIDSTAFALAQRDLINNRAPSFGDGMYGCVLSPLALYSLKTDTTWTDAASYSNITELYKGEVGRWYGFRVLEQTIPYRETAAGIEARTTGGVYHNFFMGRNAFGHTELSGNRRMIHIVRGPDTNEPIPMNTYVGWKQIYAQKALTAPHCVSVVSGVAA